LAKTKTGLKVYITGLRKNEYLKSFKIARYLRLKKDGPLMVDYDVETLKF